MWCRVSLPQTISRQQKQTSHAFLQAKLEDDCMAFCRSMLPP